MRGQRRGALGWGAGRAQAGTAGVRGRWAWRAGRRAWAGGRRQAAAARAQRARGRARQLGAGAGGRQGAGPAAGRALGTRQAGVGRARPGRLGLAFGSALGALGPFSIRFDSFFFLSHQMNTVHYK